MRTRIRCFIFGCSVLFCLLNPAHAAIPFLTKLDLFHENHGEGWRRGDVAAVATGNDILDPNEAEAVQLADGRVMFNVRSESKSNRRIVTTSPDGARHCGDDY